MNEFIKQFIKLKLILPHPFYELQLMSSIGLLHTRSNLSSTVTLCKTRPWRYKFNLGCLHLPFTSKIMVKQLCGPCKRIHNVLIFFNYFKNHLMCCQCFSQYKLKRDTSLPNPTLMAAEIIY